MNTTSFPRLLGDIGGTNARFAWQSHAGAPLTDVRTYSCAAHETLEAALRHYLMDSGHSSVHYVAFGIATAVVDDWVQMTNHAWGFSITQLQQSLALKQLVVVNDFTALALGVPSVPATELVQIGGEVPVAGAPVAVLGPGTGLGCGGFLWTKHGIAALAGEGGHVTLAANNHMQDQVLRALREKYDHVSAERLLSGAGLSLLYRSCCALQREVVEFETPEQVLQAALELNHALASQAVELFLSLLGNVAGNLALTLGARGGVYIGGGMVPRMLSRLATSEFREQFEKKGRCRPYLEKIPVFVICSAVSPALQGASRALD
jgi:glucokinase